MILLCPVQGPWASSFVIFLKYLKENEECMCRLRNIAMRDYQEIVTTGQTDGQTDTGQSDPYVQLCFAGDATSGND